jgi:molybdate transport system substrate-binding protein
MIERMRIAALSSLAVFSCLAFGGEVKVVSTVAARSTLEALKPLFEASTPHRVEFLFGTAAPLKRQIEGGESFDVTVLTPAMIDDLARSGKVDAASRSDFGRTGLGIGSRKGEAAPDIASADSLKRALQQTKGITYTREGQSGAAARALIDRLGLTEELKPRTHVDTRTGGALLAVEEGKSDLGFSFITEILSSPGLQLVGSIPDDLQAYMTLSAGISGSARDAAASKAFVQFLRSEKARAVMKGKGMEGL